jgi:hypothetical protein
MNAPDQNVPLWQTIIAGLGLGGVTVGTVYRIVRNPLVRLSALEQGIHDVKLRQDRADEDSSMNSEAIRQLHQEHGKIREMLAAQPTKDDLTRSEARTMERVASIETSVNKQIDRVVDLLGGHRNGH